MARDLQAEARQLIERLDEFDHRCAEFEYTDHGETWELLRAVRDHLIDVTRR